MQFVLAGLICFGILTLWIPAYWPVAVFQVGVFLLCPIVVWRRRKTLPGLSYPLIPLVFAVLLGSAQLVLHTTAESFTTQRAVVQWLTLLAVFLISSSLFANPQTGTWFRTAMSWFGFVIAIVATLQTFTGDGRVFWLFPSGYSDQVMGPIASRNHYAAFIELVLPMALYRALQREKDSLLYSGMAAAMFASVVASASRAGTVLAVGEIGTVVVIMWIRGRYSTATMGRSLLIIAALFVVFTGVAGWQAVWDRLLAPDPMAVRRELALSSVHMIEAHPWSGVGLGAWPIVYPRYAVIDTGAYANQAHNDWLQWTAEGGVVFAALMLGLFLWSLRPAFRTVWGMGVVAVFLHAIVDYPFSRPALGSWTIIAIGMLATNQLHRPHSN